MLLVITPDGRGIAEQWTGTFVREPPKLSVTASTDTMSLSATLSGRTTPGSRLTAGDREISIDAAGRFSASVEAPIWPSRLAVTSRDPLGNVTTQVVEVLGVVDYRGLPWAAIMLALTLLAGVLSLRTPRRRAEARPADGDGRLEELELDGIEGVPPARP